MSDKPFQSGPGNGASRVAKTDKQVREAQDFSLSDEPVERHDIIHPNTAGEFTALDPQLDEGAKASDSSGLASRTSETEQASGSKTDGGLDQSDSQDGPKTNASSEQNSRQEGSTESAPTSFSSNSDLQTLGTEAQSSSYRGEGQSFNTPKSNGGTAQPAAEAAGDNTAPPPDNTGSEGGDNPPPPSNSAPTDITFSSTQINENSPAGSHVATMGTVDPDSGDSHSYSLLNDPSGFFEIVGNEIHLKPGANIDFETATSHELRIEVTDNHGATYQETVQITVNDLNEFNVSPVSDSDGAANTVAENAAVGTSVGITAFASDADGSNNAVTYSLSDDAGGLFAIDPSTGEVTVAGALDFESATGHKIEVTATSSDGSTSTQAFSIGVNDQDEFDVSAISDSDSAANTVAENAAVGTSVGITAFASDADGSNNAVTYSLSDDAGGLFAIDPSTGEVTVAGALDFESATGHKIEVTATSSDGSTSTQAFSIGVNDQDEFDVSAISDSDGAANTVAENAAVGTSVGITAFASDADGSNNAVTYSLSDDAGGLFAIDPNTGEVTVAGALDFESATGHKIEVTATSSDGSTSTQAFSIGVNDNDEFDVSAISDTDSSANTFAENASAGTAVGITAFASDADGSDDVSYSIDDARFTVDADGTVRVANGASFDMETEASIGVTITATSDDGSISTQDFSLSVSDVKETISGTGGNDVITDAGDAGDTLLGLGGNDQLIGDDGDNIINGGSGADLLQGGGGDDTLQLDGESTWSGYQALNVNTGERVSLNGKTRNSDVFDGGEGDDTLVGTDQSDAFFLDDSFSAFQDGNTQARIDSVENVDLGAGDDLFDMTSNRYTYTDDMSVDGDSGNDTIWTAGGDDTIDGGSGNDNIFGGAGNDTIDGGADTDKASYSGNWEDYNITQNSDGSFTIEDTRSGAPDGTDNVINVENFQFADGTVSASDLLNVGPTDITVTGGSIDENSAAGSVAATLDVVDANSLDDHSFAIVDRAGNPVSDSNFELVNNNGTMEVRVKAGADLNFENVSSYDLNIQVTDEHGESYTETVTINVSDINEAPTGSGYAYNEVDEDIAGGSLMTTVSVTDVDAGDSLTYEIVGGSSLFEMVGNEVHLRADSSLDFETAQTHDFTVRATDNDGNSFDTAVTVDVSDVNEAPTISQVDLGATNEDTGITITEAQLLANSSDVDGDSLSITDLNVDPAFGTLVDNGNGSWTFSPTDDLSAQDVTFNFTASDGSLSSSSTATLDIDAIADAPELTLAATSQTILGGSTTTSSGFEGGNIDTSVSGSDWVGSLGGWSTDSDAIEIKEETLDDGSVNHFIELNDDAIDYYEDASNIWRTIDTEDGATYTIDFDYAARPGYDATVSRMEIVVDGVVVETISADGTGDTAVNWQDYSFTFTGDGTPAKIEFREAGVDQAYGRGMYMDNIAITEDLPEGMAAGAENMPIALPDISMSSTDSDGSETLNLSIGDIPVGAVLTDGTNSFTATSSDSDADISSWQLDNLTLTPPVEFSGEINMTVSATSTDGTSQNTVTDTITVNIADDDDNIVGTNGEDIIEGDSGYDTIAGGVGNDWLSGGADNDTLNGGNGDDTLIGGAGDDQIDGGAGADTAVFSGNYADYSISQSENGDYLITDLRDGSPDGTDMVSQVEAFEFADQTVQVADMVATTSFNRNEYRTNTGTRSVVDDRSAETTNQTISGTSADELLIGGSGDDYINAGAGDDDAAGLGGKDTISGGDGNDVILGGNGNDTMSGDAGNDTIDGGNGTSDTVQYSGNYSDYAVRVNDDGSFVIADNREGSPDGVDSVTNVENFQFADMTLTNEEMVKISTSTNEFIGSSNADTLYGGDGDDSIDGGAGNDWLDGGDGADDFEGKEGADTILGGGGDDTFRYAIGHGFDTVDGGTQTDTLVIDTSNPSAGSTILIEDAATYNTRTGSSIESDHILVSVDGQLSVDAVNIENVELDLSSFGDNVAINGDFTTAGITDFKITGVEGSDAVDLSGLSSATSVTTNAGQGDDTITGGAGDDVLTGSEGNDVIYGLAGDDTLIAGAGDDTLFGGDGNDLFVFQEGDGTDTVYGGEGGNWVDTVLLQDQNGGSDIGVFGVDWTVTLTNGSIDSQNADSIDLSDDADGTITMQDGTTINFNDIERIDW